MSRSEPLVSFVLPCYNAQRFLPAALESVLAQTHGALEVVALDDGSTDGTRDILDDAARRDARVRPVVRAQNRGLIETLNEGVAAARGDFIARMDADDVAAPDRIARQLEVFVQHPDTGVVGTGVRFMREDGTPLGVLHPRCTSPDGARFLALMATPVVHPSVLARAEAMRDHPYRLADEVLHTEDYELFARMTRRGVRIRNVDAPLLHLRLASGSVSRTFEEIQVRNFVRCTRAALTEATGLVPDAGVHRVLVNRIDRAVTPSDMMAGLRLLDRLRERFVREGGLSGPARAEVDAIADQQRVDVVLQGLRRGPLRRRLAVAALAVRYGGRLLSGASLGHLGSKSGRRR